MGWYICIKTIRGNAYYYRQRTWREGGSVKCHSVYLGPVGIFASPPMVGGRGPSARTLARLQSSVAMGATARGLPEVWDKANAPASQSDLEPVVKALRLPYPKRSGDRPVPEAEFRKALSAEEDQLSMYRYYAEHGHYPSGERMRMWDGVVMYEGERFIDWLVRSQCRKVDRMRAELAEYQASKAELADYQARKAERDAAVPNNITQLVELYGERAISRLTVEAGEYATADEFIKAQGEILFHTTGADFERFNRKFLGSQTGDITSNTHQGFFFSDRLDVLEGFKARLSEGVTNWRGETLAPRDVSNFRTIEKIIPKAKFIHMDDPKKLGVRDCEVLAKYFGSESGEVMKGKRAVKHVRETLDDHFTMMDAMADDDWMAGLRKHLTRHGYVGLRTSMGDGVDQYVVFDPNKFVSPDELRSIWQAAQAVSDKGERSVREDVNTSALKSSPPPAKPKGRSKSLDEALLSVPPLKLEYLNRLGSRRVSEKRFLEELAGEEKELAKYVFYAEHGQTAEGAKILVFDGKTMDGGRYIDYLVSRQATEVEERREQLASYREARAEAEREFLSSQDVAAGSAEETADA